MRRYGRRWCRRLQSRNLNMLISAPASVSTNPFLVVECYIVRRGFPIMRKLTMLPFQTCPMSKKLAKNPAQIGFDLRRRIGARKQFAVGMNNEYSGLFLRAVKYPSHRCVPLAHRKTTRNVQVRGERIRGFWRFHC
nr:hypothetical protein Iba_chr12bCG6760 [Ipomoea batatas]GMD71821.1 hypothetical protein Iba_chr12fCG2570 [Ipomoea batatas]